MRKLLFLLGLAVVSIGMSFVQIDRPASAASRADEVVLFNSGNIDAVGNGPTVAAKFVIRQPYVITSIMDYHWNNARGARPGTIALRDAAGQIYGPWAARGTPGQGGVPNANWTATPNQKIPAGEYTIVDSDPATWSQNAASGHRGMSMVKGYLWKAATPTPTPKPVTKFYAVTENKNSRKVLIWVDGKEPRGMQDVLNYHLEPGWKGSLAVSMPSNGQIKFIAGDGSGTSTGQYNRVVTSCVWTGDPKVLTRIPYIVFQANGSLSCGTTNATK